MTYLNLIHMNRACRSPGCTAAPVAGTRHCGHHGIARHFASLRQK